MTTLDGEVANTYRLLTADDVSTGVRTQAETTLEHNGIDPDRLQQDFISQLAIHTYLTKHYGVERPSEPTEDRVGKTEGDDPAAQEPSRRRRRETPLITPGYRNDHARDVRRAR